MEFGSPEEFVSALRQAIDEESATIRETDFDQVDRAVNVDLFFGPDSEPQQVRGELDILDRVVLPAFVDAENLAQVGYEADDHYYYRGDVVRVEPRYEGDQHIHWVCYLEETHAQKAETVAATN